VLHVIGHAPSCAPNHAGSGHIADSAEDVLYAGGEEWLPSLLDANHDDYYGAAIADCLDFESSAFLEPSPADAAPPPGWPYYNLANAGCAAESTVVPDPLGVATQAMFVNAYAPAGAPAAVDVSELVLDSGSGLYVRALRASVPYLEAAVLPTEENAVFVVSDSGGTCLAVVAAEDRPGRFVAKAP
jgi:hypothetical protein